MKQSLKILSKYIAAFYYFDKTLVVLSATCTGISIIFFSITEVKKKIIKNSKK